jgi:large subunit ribosomal protein L32e
MKKFVRRDAHKFSRIGKGRKKLQKWRKPKGRHNKMREKRFSYPASPNVGYKKPKNEAGKVKGLNPVMVYNIKDLESVKKNMIAVVGKIGARKKIEILKKADEMKVPVANVGGKK